MSRPEKPLKEKRPAGRPDKFRTHVQPRLEEIEKWYREGAIDEEVCEQLGVGLRNFARYKVQHPKFFDQLEEARQYANHKVVKSLFRRTQGIEYEEITREPVYVIKKKDGTQKKIILEKEFMVTKRVTKFIPPDVKACFGWLYNRMPDEWRYKQDMQGVSINQIIFALNVAEPGLGDKISEIITQQVTDIKNGGQLTDAGSDDKEESE